MKDYEHVRSLLAGEVNILYTHLPEAEHIKDMNKRTNRILDANYEKANIDAYMQEYNKLNEKERLSLRSLLKKYENLFDGTLGKWKLKPVSLNIKPNAKLVQSRPFSVPHFHQEKLKKEIKRLCDIGVLRKNPTAQFSSPSFIIPKKDMTIRFVSDFGK